MTLQDAMRRIEARIERDQQALAVLRELAGEIPSSLGDGDVVSVAGVPGIPDGSYTLRDPERVEVAPARPSRRSSGRPNGLRRPDGQTRQRILEALSGNGEGEGPVWSTTQLADYCGLTTQAIRLQLAKMRAANEVRAVGSGSKVRYYLV